MTKLQYLEYFAVSCISHFLIFEENDNFYNLNEQSGCTVDCRQIWQHCLHLQKTDSTWYQARQTSFTSLQIPSLHAEVRELSSRCFQVSLIKSELPLWCNIQNFIDDNSFLTELGNFQSFQQHCWDIRQVNYMEKDVIKEALDNEQCDWCFNYVAYMS